jgi:sialic acid synthase SpsE
MNKVIIIAEAGVNHNGSFDLAKKLIDVAAISGVDFVKFQTWVTDELMEKDAPKAQYQNLNDPSSSNQYDMVKRLELTFQEFRELHDYCKLKSIKTQKHLIS